MVTLDTILPANTVRISTNPWQEINFSHTLHLTFVYIFTAIGRSASESVMSLTLLKGKFLQAFKQVG